MKLSSYIKDKIIIILIELILIVLITMLLLLFNVNYMLVIYIPIVMLISFLLMFFYDYMKRKIFFNNAFKILNKLDKKYLFTEMVNNQSFIEGELFMDMLYEINKSMIEEINNYKYSNIDFKEYIELWCHEIKTPIATSKLIIDNNKNDVTTSILEEANKIDSYVDQVLYYARSNNVDRDYIIVDVKLEDVINKVIKKNKKNLINKKIKIDININNMMVKSDAKWLEFIINQIVVNSIKYSKDNNGKIEIYGKKNINNGILYIKDNGIGINAEEIDKVFDKGFTGSNGRLKYNSTGIGLYLCKKLCDKLGLSISVSSIINRETTVAIVFPNSSMISKVKD